MAGRGAGQNLRALMLLVSLAGSLAFMQMAQAQEPPNPPENPQPQTEPPKDAPPPAPSGQSPSPPASGQSSGQSPSGQSPSGQSPSPSGQTPEQSSPQTEKPAEDQKPDATNPPQSMGDAAKQVAQATLVQLRDWETEWLVGAYVSRNRKLVPLTEKQRERLYLQQTVLTPGAYLKRAFDAGFDQARGVPPQWDDGVAGYMERWWSREGQFIAANSLAALGDDKLGYEPRYDQCRCRGFWPRLRHATVRNFVTYNRSEQELRPQWALYGGAFGGGMIATAWKPKPLNPFVQGAYGIAGQAGWGILANFFTEFAVDINRKLGAKE